MAVTNAYYAVVRIPVDAGNMDDAVYTGAVPLASGNSASFTLRGGLYCFEAAVTGSGHCKLTRLGQDGSTYAAVATDLTAGGYTTAYLPQGTYRVELS